MSAQVVFSWEMPGAQPLTLKTDAARPSLQPEWCFKARLNFERGKAATRFFERRKCAVEVWKEARPSPHAPEQVQDLED